MPLNPRQQAFVTLYLTGEFTAAEAYQQAGFKAESQRSRESGASRMLRNDEVRAAIDAAKEAAAERAVTTAQWVLGRLRVEALRTGEGSSRASRVRALELLGKYLRLFPDSHEVSGPTGSPVEVRVVEVLIPDNGRDPRPGADGPATLDGGSADYGAEPGVR